MRGALLYATAKAALEGLPRALASMAGLHPPGRVGRPEEVADLVAWLLGAPVSSPAP